MDSPVQTLLAAGAQLTDAALERLLPTPDTLPHSIHRAMRHSVFAGGKRLRPILCMEAAKMVAGAGVSLQGVASLGAAIEMIHAKLALTGEIIAHIDMLGPRKSDEVDFKAPMTPGQYPFLCTFPAHYQTGMKGFLVVK